MSLGVPDVPRCFQIWKKENSSEFEVVDEGSTGDAGDEVERRVVWKKGYGDSLEK